MLDVHYHPIGKPEVDSGSKLVLMLADSRPNLIARTILLGNFNQPVSAPFDSTYGLGALVQQPDETAAAFNIPANAKNHIEEMTWTWKSPLPLWRRFQTIRRRSPLETSRSHRRPSRVAF